MIDTIAELQQSLGAHVSLFPTFGFTEAERAHLPEGVALIHGELEDHLAGVLASKSLYSAVIVSRPHNYQQVIAPIRRWLPGVPVIYDAEALYFTRLERQAELAGGVTRTQLLSEARAMQELEASIASEVEAVVCISDDEAGLLAAKTKRPVIVNGPLLADPTFTTPGFLERTGMGFIAGWSAGPNAPNVDGLRWFARHVWPRVLARVPSAKLLVTGDAPPQEVLRFACDSICFIGRVADLEQFYASLRVVVVPIRYGSGVKLKAVEALQFGVPTVATAVGAENIPADVEDLLAVMDDTGDFAEAVASLYCDQSAWESQREILAKQTQIWRTNRTPSVWPALFAQLGAEVVSGTRP
jgi:hypothetical protein